MRFRTSAIAALLITGILHLPILAAWNGNGQCQLVQGPNGAAWLCGAVEVISEQALDQKKDANNNHLFVHDGNKPPVPNGWSRDGSEIEATYRLTCDGEFDRSALFRRMQEPGGSPARPWRRFRQMRNDSQFEAFSIEWGLDEMPMGDDATALRETIPYLTTHISNSRNVYLQDGTERVDRRVIGTASGPRKLKLGSDVMDDWYMDTPFIFSLLNYVDPASGQNHPLVYRARMRYNDWDDPDPNNGRVLVASKEVIPPESTAVLPVKTALKVDDRSDSTNARMVADLVPFAQRGLQSWGGTSPAFMEIHGKLLASGDLPTVGQFSNVLAVDALGSIRSVRSRFHMDETARSNVKGLYDRGNADLNGLIADAQAALPGKTGAEARAIQAFLDKAQAFPTELATRSGVPNAVAVLAQVTSDRVQSPGSLAATQQQKAVADAYSDIRHELADMLGADDRALTRLIVGEPASDEGADAFKDWLVGECTAEGSEGECTASSGQRDDTTGKQFAVYRQWEPFARRHKEILALPAAQRDAQIAAFNTAAGTSYSLAEFTEIGDELNWLDKRRDYKFVAEGGTAAKRLFFENARQFYVPGSRVGGNLFINTLDLSGLYEGAEIADDKLISSEFVNEVQIELEREQPFLERIAQLNTQIAGATGAERQRLTGIRDGAQWVLDQYLQGQDALAQARREAVFDGIGGGGRRLCQGNLGWDISLAAKGTRLMELLQERAGGGIVNPPPPPPPPPPSGLSLQNGVAVTDQAITTPNEPVVFQLDVPAGTTRVTIDMTPPNGVDYDVFALTDRAAASVPNNLGDTDGLGRGRAGGSSPEQFTFSTNGGTTFFIRVEGWSGDNSPSPFSVKATY